MEALTNLLSWRHIAVMAAVYFASLAFYRLFLHPLAQFPGPKLAAITLYYEAYYDVVQNGQYTFKIAEMHKKYGTIVRISPYELHVIDPTFFEKLYRQDGRWDKYAWAYDAFSSKGAILCSTAHDIHKARRLPLSSFFSKVKVASRQDMIRRNVDKLCDRISRFAGSKTAANLGAPISAFTRDVSTELILGKTYNNLDREDFNVGMTKRFQDSGGYIWRITKHVRWFGPTMRSIPFDWIMKTADENTKAFFHYLKQSAQDSKDLLAVIASSIPHDEVPRTIVHETLDSNLPPADKPFDRVFDDVLTVTGAGFETTATALRLIFYHVFSNAEILQRLRTELASATAQSSDMVELRTLEQLSYLTSVLMEGMRLSPGLASRMARIAPDRDLVYGEWRISAGTPVGMTTLLMHTDKALYPDPKRFDPDRWMDLDARKKADKTYAPFSRGTRICLGMYLAWAEMYLVLAALVQCFDFQFKGISGEDFECKSDQFIIGTKGKGVLKALVTPYKG